MKKATLVIALCLIMLIILPASVFAQTGNIKGKIYDSDNLPLIGVNIVVKGTTLGTVSDIDGNFVINNVQSGTVELVASFIGYLLETKTVELASGQTAEISFLLIEDIAELSEVVVIGYGVQKKSDLTSAVASVSAEDLQDSKASNVQEAMQGRTAGVMVLSNTAAPGANVSVEIRGINSINGTSPLWIVDGVAADPKTVNSADIESMEILKDASSAAIYGAQGAAGVVLITTKKGTKGKTQVSFNAWGGISEITKYLDVADAQECYRMNHEVEVLKNLPLRKYLTTMPDTLETVNYQDQIFRKAYTQNYDLSVTAGTEKSNFYMGIGYTDQEGVLKNTDYEKLTARMNSEHKANKWLSVGANTQYTRQVYSGFEEWELLHEYNSPIIQALQYHSFVPIYGTKQTDSEYDEGWSNTPLGNFMNPVANIALKNHKNTDNNMTGSFFVKLQPIEGLTLESRATGNVVLAHSYTFNPVYKITASLLNNTSSITRNSSRYTSWQLQNIATYNKTLFDFHNISLVAGFESGKSMSEWESGTRRNLINQSEEMWYFDAGKDNESSSQFPTGSAVESSGYSYLGRFSYDYRGMVLTQVNFRRDYSSKFGPNNRVGNFPSFSLGFKFTELDVVKNTLPFMNFGKIRYGWGKIGNSSIPDYIYYSTVAFEDTYMYSFDNINSTASGAAPDKYVNLDIAWEGVVTSNLGVDLQFLNNRLSVTADYFERHNEGMLMYTPVAYWSGWVVRDAGQEGEVGNPMRNVGHLSNKGIEFMAGWKESKGNFKYGANANFTYLTTITGDITPDTLLDGTTKGLAGYLTRTIEGQPIGEYYGYIYEGIFRKADCDENGMVINQPYTEVDGVRTYAQPNAKAGDMKFKDVNGDGVLNSKDEVAIGNPNPKFMFGLNLNGEYNLGKYGSLDISAFFQGVAGNKIFNATKFYLFNPDGAFNWSSEYVNDHYSVYLEDREGKVASVDNDGATYPRLNSNGLTFRSSFYIEDGSYLRLKNLEIGYNLPKDVTKLIDIENIRIFVGGRNLFILTKYSGYSPEVGSTSILTRGLDQAAYPQPRMFTAGINVTF